MSSLTDSIGTLLAAWVSFVLRFRKAAIIVVLAAASGAVWYAAENLGVNTDTTNMISAELPWRRDFIEFREAFPVRDRNLLVVIDAPTPERAHAFAVALLAELRRSPELYRAVFMAGEGEFFEQEGLLFLPLASLAELTDRLAAAQPLLGLLKRDFNGARIIDVATRAAAAESSGAALAPFYTELAATLDAARAGRSEPLAWNQLLGQAQPTTRRIVVLQPALDFASLQPARAAMVGIRAIAERLNALEPSPVRVRLTGAVAMEQEELATVSRGAGIAGVATLAMVALVLYAALRSWRMLSISLVTLIAGLALTAAFAAAAVGHLNLISIAFVVLNVGLGSDYVIHVCLRQKELQAEGLPVDAALVTTMRGVGASLVLCAVTTAAGFYSFIPTQFEGVSELGLIAGTGVFVGLLVSVTLLPALVGQFVKAAPGRDGRTWINPRIFAPLTRRSRTVLGATLAIVLVTFAALPWVTFDSNPIHLRDPESESVATLLELAAAGDAPLLNLVAVAPDAATARDWSAKLAQLPTVSSVITIDSLVPGNQEDKLTLLEDAALLLGPDFAQLARSPADPEALAVALAQLAAGATERADDAQRELQRAAAAFLDHVAELPRAARRSALLNLDASLTGALPEQLARLSAALNARPFGRDALPAGLTERWLSAGRELVEIVPAEDVSDNAAAARFVDSVHSVVEKATGLPVVYQEASNTVVRAFAQALAYALVMVTAIIWLVLRDPRDVALVIVPIILSAGVTAGITALVGMPLNYANIIALPLLVGIGVDNGIHVVHRMRAELADTELFNTSTLRAVLASGFTTVASFGNLAFSSHVGTASMGKLLALGLAVSMAATLISLPAWLKLFGRRARRAVVT
jgi:hopanoid biosynthesis associated RND transporter like protein HpnN